MIQYKLWFLIAVCLIMVSCYTTRTSSTEIDGVLYKEKVRINLYTNLCTKIRRWKKFDQNGLIEKGYSKNKIYCFKVKLLKKRIVKYNSVSNKVIYRYVKRRGYSREEERDSMNINIVIKKKVKVKR